MKNEKYSLFSKIEILRRFFHAGCFLESMEKVVDFPTIHLEYGDIQHTHQHNYTDDNSFQATSANFLEVSLCKSADNERERKCFLILGFKTPAEEEGSIEHFLSNWKELTGLGNFLLFLSPKYFVRRVIFMKNMTNVGRDDNMFQFFLILEVFHKKEDIIYLLDYVQRIRSWRNVGFISLYGEIPASLQD